MNTLQTDRSAISNAMLAAAVSQPFSRPTHFPIIVETGDDYTLRGVFRDMATLPGMDDMQLEDGFIRANVPRKFVSYLHCDPRIERISPG